MSTQETKRQHYVPRTYLKNFAQQRGKEYFIDTLFKDNIQSPIKSINIKNVCLKKNLYTLDGDTKEERQLLEDFYSDEIESKYNDIYSILTDPVKKMVSIEERDLIIATVITMFYRTIKWITSHNTFMDMVIRRAYDLCIQSGNDYFKFEDKKISIKGKTPEDLIDDYVKEVRQTQILTQINAAFRLKKLRVLNDGIFVVKIDYPELEFVTSDHPVHYYNPDTNRPIPFDFTNILSLPLDSKHILYLMPYKASNLIVRANYDSQVAILERISSNSNQFHNSEKFILGSKLALNHLQSM